MAPEKKMENFRRGGIDRRTGDRSDYGRRNSERNFSGNRNSRHAEGYSRDYSHRPYSNDRFNGERFNGERFGNDRSGSSEEAAAPKRRPRIIRGKDGEIKSVPAGAPARNSAPAFERKSRSYGSGEERRGGYRHDDGERRFSPRKPGRGFSGQRERSQDGQRSFGDRRGRGGYDQRGHQSQRRPKQAEISGINRMISRKQIQDAQYSDNDTVNIPVKEEVRLNKFIANSGVCSRREADNYILAGVVTVNGQVVTELGSKVNIYTDDVRFNGERLKGEEKVYIVMNKPKGFVTTSSDPHAEKTVMDLLKGCKARVFPVGRLDKYTTGVLMFTNDGEMAEKLTHPSFDKKKIYQVMLDKELEQEDFDKIKAGILLSDGEIAADELEYVDDNDHRKIGIEIHSGKNRIVRRIFESLGYEVRGLDRVYFAGLTKKGLKRGQWRFLTQGEENILKMGAYN